MTISKAWCQYNRWDRYDSSKRTPRSERLYGNRALTDRSDRDNCNSELNSF